MSGVNTGALSRSIRALTIGSIDTYDTERRQREQEEQGEWVQQFHVPVRGTVGETIAWTDIELIFDIPFMIESGERQSDFDRPTFYYGSVRQSGIPCIVQAQVREWMTADDLTVVGAKVDIGIWGPGNTGVNTAWSGEVHLSFQGYGTIRDEDDSAVNEAFDGTTEDSEVEL